MVFRVRRGFGSGGGGGGLTLGPPTNTFNGATKAAAETARNTYATANATWLAMYDASPTFTITLTWPVTPTNTVYQSRRGSAWADVTGLVRGPTGTTGSDGDDGTQARFLVYCYVNSAVAPTAIPTGGTFTRSTGVLVVPSGYTAIPSTPGSGEITYRSEAVVNPETDTDVVNLVWPLAAELPAYSVVGLAEAAASEAEAARDLSQQYAGQAQDIPAGSPRGGLVATSPTLPTAATGSNSVIAFGVAELWTIEADAPAGFEAGPAASNERLYLPDIHPAGSIGIWEVVEVAGVEVAEVFISHGGIQGATGADRRLMLPVSVTADALIRTGFWQRSTVASYLQLTGNSDTLPANTVVKIYLAVVRGEEGPGGGGIGGTNETNLAIANRDADSLEVTSDTGTDATLPAASTTEAGLMSAADKVAVDRSQPHWYLTGGTEVGRTATYTAPADWPGISAIAEGTAITFEVPDPWGYNGSAGLAVQIGANLQNVNGSGGDQFSALEVRAGATYRAIWDGSTRWKLLDSGITNAEVKAANEANDDTNAFTDDDETALDNAGGQHRFGAVDPVAADGNDKDEWTNTTDGTLWIKAAGCVDIAVHLPVGRQRAGSNAH